MKNIRPAKIQDAEPIQKIINYYSRKGLMIQKSLSEIYENIRNYFVYEKKGKVVGTCCLKIYWKDLAEICSLAVGIREKKKGMGTLLLNHTLSEAKKMGITTVFVLTYVPGFFAENGFEEIDKSKLPQKIWGECIRCHKFPVCDESAMVKYLE
ncbi:MAG: N-acetyltransferase [Candidatus Schekmanbacteria bacterium]|nr:N-acetyltransferase [Candidatus Schekmanbacteria bacterium]